MAALAWLAMAAAADAACPSSMLSCSRTDTGNHFTDAVWQLETGAAVAEGARGVLCDAARWQRRADCRVRCPLRLEITAPKDLQGGYCVQDNAFTPYRADAHVDRAHALHGKEMEVVALPPAHRTGCARGNVSAFDGAGKVVMVTRGECTFAEKMGNLRVGAKASLGLMVNNHLDYEYIAQYMMMVGPSQEVGTLPAMTVPRHAGLLLLDALDRGAAVRGKVVHGGCGDAPPPPPPPASLCPNLALRDLCGAEPDPSRRLCSQCPVEMTLGQSNVSVCVWGNDLVPYDPANTLWTQRPPPVTEDVLVAEEMPGDGCDPANYTGMRGRVVVLPAPHECMQYEAARAAAAAGVAAVVFAGRKGGVEQFARGEAHAVRTAVHYIASADAPAVFAHAREHGAPAPGGAAISVGFRPGGKRPRVLAPPAAAAGRSPVEREVVDHVSVALFTPPMMVCGGLIVLLLGSLPVVLLRGRPQRLTGHRADGPRRIPLSVASIALSLSLLVAVASAAFGLAVAAGRDAVDTSMADGHAATAEAHRVFRTSVHTLSLKLRRGTIQRVSQGLEALLAEGGAAAEAAAALYTDVDDEAPWSAFADRYRDFELLARVPREGMVTKVFTKARWFASNQWVTDYPAGAAGAVVAFQEPAGAPQYPLQRRAWSEERQEGQDWYLRNASYESVFDFTGGDLGDVLAYGVGLPRGGRTFHLSRHALPHLFYDADAQRYRYVWSCFVPVYSRRGQYIGVVETAVPTEYVQATIQDALASTPLLANMTAAVYEHNERRLLAGTPRDLFVSEAVWRRAPGLGLSIERLRTLRESDQVEINALDALLDDEAAWSSSQHATLNETYFTPRDCDVFDIYVAGDGLADVSPRRHVIDVPHRKRGRGRKAPETRMTRVYDAVVGAHVVEKAADARIDIRMELTLDAAEEKKKAAPWLFADAWAVGDMTLPGRAEPCAAVKVVGTDGAACMARPHYQKRSFSVTVLYRPDVEYGVELTPAAPYLVSDSTAPMGNYHDLRVWGNGQMSLANMNCRTPPLRSPIPAGAWTAVTAVHDAEAGACRVYINGTLAGEANRSVIDGEWGRDVSDRWAVGYGLAGRIGRVLMHDVAYSHAEAAGVYKQVAAASRWQEPFQRVVPPQQWFVDLADFPVPVSSGMRVKIAALLPVADVLGEVEANDALFERNHATRRHNTEHNLEQALRQSAAVVTVAVLACVAMFLAFNRAITRPFHDMAVAMTQAALMDVGIVPETASVLTEVCMINAAAATMIRNLREYRSFIPQSVLDSIRNAPTGGDEEQYVTIMFTDIKSSCQLWEQSPSGMNTALAAHNAIIRKCIAEFEGFEVKTIGDAFMVAFSDPAAACRCAMQIQVELHCFDWAEELLALDAAAPSPDGLWRGIQIRVGVNYGPAMFRAERGRVDYLGPAVNVAARVEGHCVPGAVCITESVMRAVHLSAIDSPTVICAGARALKGVSESVELFMLLPAALAGRAAAVEMQLAEVQGIKSNDSWVSPAYHAARDRTHPLAASNRDTCSSWSLGSGSSAWVPVRRHLERCRQCVGVTSFHAFSDEAYDSALTYVNDALAVILHAAGATSGAVTSVVASRVHLAWTAARASDQVQHAVQYVTRLREDNVIGMTHTALSCGTVYVGNIGRADQRFATALGGTMNLLALVHDACVHLDARALWAALEVDPFLWDKIRDVVRPVDSWTVERADGFPCDAVHIYEVQAGRTAEPAAGWGAQYWCAFEAGVPQDLPVADDPIAARVQEMLARRTHLRPLPISHRYELLKDTRRGSITPIAYLDEHAPRTTTVLAGVNPLLTPRSPRVVSPPNFPNLNFLAAVTDKSSTNSC